MLALVGYAGDAKHEVTRLQRHGFNGASCPSFIITVKTKQVYILFDASPFSTAGKVKKPIGFFGRAP